MYPFKILHKSKLKNQKEKSDFVFLFYGSQILVNVDIRVKDKGRVKKYVQNTTPDPDSALISGCLLKYFAPPEYTSHSETERSLPRLAPSIPTLNASICPHQASLLWTWLEPSLSRPLGRLLVYH